MPPIPDDSDAPPDAEAQQFAPVNSDSFWLELVGEIRQELSPPVSGFFVATPTAPVRGVLRGNTLELRCQGSFPAALVVHTDRLGQQKLYLFAGEDLGQLFLPPLNMNVTADGRSLQKAL